MNHIIKKLSRLMLDARSAKGMVAGMPKITVDCLDLDVLLTRLNAKSERIAELEKEQGALKTPILQIVAKKLDLLREPNVLTGMYRTQLRDGYWEAWEPIEALKEQVK